MWSSLFLDYSLHKNFNVGFASHKNDIHIHLSQWQYWWWFWFALVWTLYFFVILRLYYNKTENFNLTLNTSLRSHGKWGDFLVALIPLSWCGNILINSNFILRMLEWQNESSLFTVRIQGKQWYWSYKYSSDTDFRLKNVYINVGNNNWVKSSNHTNITFNSHNSFLTYLFDREFKVTHREAAQKKGRSKPILRWNRGTQDSTIMDRRDIDFLENTRPSVNTNFQVNNIFLSPEKYTFRNSELSSYLSSNQNLNLLGYLNTKEVYEHCINVDVDFNYPTRDKKVGRYSPGRSKHNTNVINGFINHSYNTRTFFEHDTLEEVDETADNVRLNTPKFPIRLIKGVMTKHNIKTLENESILNKNIMLNYSINNNEAALKIDQAEQFWGFRQKRYKKLRIFVFPAIKKYDSKTYTHIENFTNKNNIERYNLYTAVRNNKYKTEMIPVTLARRLLRTKRTLVLPAHINITLITNSYDVVHSWFVPGLGLKIDCVPGRSTHHSLYLDNIGFYYGQCAEICGRYHHHMPIRVCALSFEHFMLWWQTRGLPRMYRLFEIKEKKGVMTRINKLPKEKLLYKFK